MADSPFDDSPEEPAPPPSRKRRPWWRWNLITLALALFALVWLRQLFGFGLGAIWLLVFSIAAVWGVVPAFFVPTVLTTMSDHPGPSFVNRQRGSRSDRVLLGLKAVSLLLMVVSLAHFAIVCVMLFPAVASVWFDGAARGGPAFFFQASMLSAFAQPISQFVVAAILFVLTEIALRLERRPTPAPQPPPSGIDERDGAAIT